jgi:hypothetical protein
VRGFPEILRDTVVAEVIGLRQLAGRGLVAVRGTAPEIVDVDLVLRGGITRTDCEKRRSWPRRAPGF